MKINEIFTSINGEVNKYGQGTFSTFIRLQGCNLRCSYCDTKYAQDSSRGTEMEIQQIINKVGKANCQLVTITGGEPLLQMDGFQELTHGLSYEGHKIIVETNGSIPPYPVNVSSWAMDYKLQSSGETKQMNLEHYETLGADDYIKFIILNRSDFEQAVEMIDGVWRWGTDHTERPFFAFSPGYGHLSARTLMEWMKEKELYHCILNVQIHRLIGIQ